MHTSLFKTSLYTRSLLANPPAALPQIPTLAELKERTASIPIPIPTTTTSDQARSSFSWSSMPKSLLPSYSNSPPPSYAPTSVKSWARLDDGEVKRELTMEGSTAYVRDRKVHFGMSPSTFPSNEVSWCAGKQPEIGQFEGRSEKTGWISWWVFPLLNKQSDVIGWLVADEPPSQYVYELDAPMFRFFQYHAIHLSTSTCI